MKGHLVENLPTTVQSTKEEMVHFYTQMLLLRRLETAADNLYKAKEIRGFCHLYSGQEAVAVGMEAALTKEDHIITAYRDHALYVTRGGAPGAMIAELLGKKTGAARGKGGSMHMYSKSSNFYGGNGIVGAQVPVGAGLALGQQYQSKERVSIAMYGDGAANQGQVFEAFNMAALWKLPCIFVCENNRYAMGTSIKRSSASTTYYTRGDYVPGIRVDGMNVFAVKAASQYAVDFVKKNGPIILEMDTYRYGGHSMSDPGTTYRTRDEISKIRESKDPVAFIKGKLLSLNLVTDEEIKAIDKKVKDETDEAIKFAKNSQEPDLSELWTNIYVEKDPLFIRGVELQNSHNLPQV